MRRTAPLTTPIPALILSLLFLFTPAQLPATDSAVYFMVAGGGVSTVPKQNLLAYFKVPNTIGLSTADYSKLDPVWQDVFFVDSSTPRTVPFLDVYARGELNTTHVVGNRRWIAVYDNTVSQDILDLAIAKAGQTDVNYIYVDSAAAGGGDGSESTPYNTISDALTAYTDGDSILLKRGSTFREQFEIPNNSRVVPYGTGSLPVVSGAEPLTNGSFSLTSGQTNTYELSLPVTSTNNPYVGTGLITDKVLMVWEDNVRLGGRFENYQTSIAGVEANAGSWWYDTATDTLYIHPSDGSDITSNGKTYEASVRTLALHGGDNFFVAGIQAEKSYANTSVGQQGYQLLGYKSGHYYKCKAYHSWNHNVGVANNEQAGELLFERVLAEDAEEISSLAATLFVAYKGGGSDTPSTVTFKNCVAKQPSRHPTIQTTGFFTHGDSVAAIYDGVSAENCYYGAAVRSDADTVSQCSITTASKYFINNRFDITTRLPVNLSGVRSIESANSILVFVDGVTINNHWCYDVGKGVVAGDGTGAAIPVLQSYYVGSDPPTGEFDLIGVTANAARTRKVQPQNCTFINMGMAMAYAVTGSDNNTFYGNQDIIGSIGYSPYRYTSLSSWQGASGQDLNSSAPATAPKLPDGIDAITLPDIFLDFD